MPLIPLIPSCRLISKLKLTTSLAKFHKLQHFWSKAIYIQIWNTPKNPRTCTHISHANALDVLQRTWDYQGEAAKNLPEQTSSFCHVLNLSSQSSGRVLRHRNRHRKTKKKTKKINKRSKKLSWDEMLNKTERQAKQCGYLEQYKYLPSVWAWPKNFDCGSSCKRIWISWISCS